MSILGIGVFEAFATQKTGILCIWVRTVLYLFTNSLGMHCLLAVIQRRAVLLQSHFLVKPRIWPSETSI
jgi:hypothetical protein